MRRFFHSLAWDFFFMILAMHLSSSVSQSVSKMPNAMWFINLKTVEILSFHFSLVQLTNKQTNKWNTPEKKQQKQQYNNDMKRCDDSWLNPAFLIFHILSYASIYDLRVCFYCQWVSEWVCVFFWVIVFVFIFICFSPCTHTYTFFRAVHLDFRV